MMKAMLKVGAAGVLALGGTAAQASITAGSSSAPGDLLLFAEVVNSSKTPVGYYVGDTTIQVGGATPGASITAGTLISSSSDSNLQQLLALAAQPGNTLEWAVQGAGGQAGTNDQSSVTTVGNATDLKQLQSLQAGNVAQMVSGMAKSISYINAALGPGSTAASLFSTSSKSVGNWSVEAGGVVSNLEYWYGNGTFTAQTGYGSTTLYGAIAPTAGSYTVKSLGTVTLSSSGLVYSLAGLNGADTYSISTRQLTMPSLGIGGATFSDVVVNVSGIDTGPSGSSPNGPEDTYDPGSGHLTVQSVNVGTGTYYNAVVSVASLVSIGAVAGADSYNGTNGQLTIASVQVGSKTYTDCIITVGGIVSLAGGMPQNALDVYDAAHGQLLVAAATYAGKVYTNVTVKVAKILQVNGTPLATANTTEIGRPNYLRDN